MHLSLLIVVLATLLAAEHAVIDYPAESAGWRIAGSMVATLIAPIGGLVGAICATRISAVQRDGKQSFLGEPGTSYDAVQRRWEQVCRWRWLIWTTIGCGVPLLLGWPDLVRHVLNWGGLSLVTDLAILLPVWLPWLLFWIVDYDVERSLAGQAGSHRQRGAYVLLHARHYLVLIFLPILVLLCWQDLVSHWSLEPGLNRWLLQACPLLVMTAGYPLVLRFAWGMSPLPQSELRSRILATAKAEGVEIRDLLVWPTQGRMKNAAVMGAVPHFRYVLLTDQLLAELGESELLAVVKHELAHVSQRHLGWRFAVLLLPLWMVGFSYLLGPFEPFWRDQADSTFLIWGVPIFTIVYAIAALGWLSHLFEYEADLIAAGLDHVNEHSSEQSLIRAFNRLCPPDDAYRRRRSWLHPSMEERIQFLSAAARDRWIGPQYIWKVRGATWMIVALFSLPVWCLLVMG